MSPEQIILVGLIASAITFVIQQIAKWNGSAPNRLTLTIVLYVVSLFLGWLWTGVIVPAFPPFADPVTFVAALLEYLSLWIAAVTPVLGAATLIYNLLYEKVVVPLARKFQGLMAVG